MLIETLKFLTGKQTRETKVKFTRYVLTQVWGLRVANLCLPIIEKEGL